VLVRKLHRLHGEVSRLKSKWEKSNNKDDKLALYKKHKEYRTLEAKIKEMRG
jgi:hypothetical protein